jgi:beta-1,4-mannosyltransferase
VSAADRRLFCGMFPDPHTGTEWMQKGNKLLIHIARALEARGVRCVRTPSRPNWRWLHGHQANLDVIHLHWPEAYYRAHGRLIPGLDLLWVHWFVTLTRHYKIPYVWTVHDLYPHGTNPTNVWRTEKLARKFLFQNAFTVIVNCSSAIPIVSREFGEPHRYVVAPLGNFRVFYPDVLTDAQARKSLGLEPKDIVFLVFGGQRRNRNAIEVIQAFRSLKENNARLVVAGRADRSVRANVEEAASTDPRIKTFLEFVAEDKVEVFLKACDFLIMPGHWYLTSAVVSLGLSYSRPVMVPSWGCSKEMIGNAGYVYDETKSESLLPCLQTALSSDLEHLRFLADQRGRQLSWEINADQLLRAYT